MPATPERPSGQANAAKPNAEDRKRLPEGLAYRIHALTFVLVINARTGKNIDYGTSGITEGVIIGDSVPPWSNFAAAEWPDPPSEELLAKAHETVLNLMQKSIPHGLHRAGLY
jgi:hypothetical protein